MLKKFMVLTSLFLLSLSVAYSQGRGGGGQGKGQGAGQGQGANMGQGAGQGQHGTRAGDTQRDRERIRTTTQQRDQIRACDRLGDGIQKQARKMSQSSGKKFNAEEAKKQQSQIRERLHAMDQEHERLVKGLDTSQQQAWQEQIRNMNQFREQLRTQTQEMDRELGFENPDATRVTERAREMEQAMNNWRKQYRILSSQSEL